MKEVFDKAIRLLGGYAYCAHFGVEKLLFDARGLTLRFKTSGRLEQDTAKAALGL